MCQPSVLWNNIDDRINIWKHNRTTDQNIGDVQLCCERGIFGIRDCHFCSCPLVDHQNCRVWPDRSKTLEGSQTGIFYFTSKTRLSPPPVFQRSDFCCALILFTCVQAINLQTYTVSLSMKSSKCSPLCSFQIRLILYQSFI